MELKYSEDGALRKVSAYDGGALVGLLEWTTRKLSARRPVGEILSVWVHPQRRREGVATALLAHAQEVADVKPRHSANKTPQGASWVFSLSQ